MHCWGLAAYQLRLALQIAEFDSPWNLIRKEDGMFRDMCMESGSFSSIDFTAAQQNFRDQAHSFQIGSATLPALCVVTNVSLKAMVMDQGLLVPVRPQPVQYE